MSRLKKETKEQIKDIRAHYPTSESAILPVLHLVQDEFRHIDQELIEDVSRELSLPPQYVYSTATFYTMFNLKPVGKYHIQVCRNLSCSLLGSRKLIDHISRKLGIVEGETTPDGKFTLSTVECLGACGGAPVMMVNEKYYENLTVDSIDSILGEFS